MIAKVREFDAQERVVEIDELTHFNLGASSSSSSFEFANIGSSSLSSSRTGASISSPSSYIGGSGLVNRRADGSMHSVTPSATSSVRPTSGHAKIAAMKLNTDPASQYFFQRFARVSGNITDGDRELALEIQAIENAGGDTSGALMSAFLQTGADPMNLNERNHFQNEMGPPTTYTRGGSGEHIGSFDRVPSVSSRFGRNNLVSESLPQPCSTGNEKDRAPSATPSTKFADGVKAKLRKIVREGEDDAELYLLKTILSKDSLESLLTEYFNDLVAEGSDPNPVDCIQYLKRWFK